jgi:hypothetical protein
VPGNIRQAKTFVELLGSLVYELKQKLANTQAATTETTHHFVQQVSSSMGWETKAMQFCAERLRSLLRTLEVGDAAPGAPNPLFRDKNRHHRDKSQSKRPAYNVETPAHLGHERGARGWEEEEEEEEEEGVIGRTSHALH